MPRVDHLPAPVTEQIKSHYPGKVGWANERGHFPGTAFALVRSDNIANALNQWAEENEKEHFLVVEVLPIGTEAALIVYTKVLAEDEVDDINAFAQEFKAFVEKKKAKEEELKAKAEEEIAKRNAELKAKKEAEEKETKRLIELGMRCERHHKKAKT